MPRLFELVVDQVELQRQVRHVERRVILVGRRRRPQQLAGYVRLVCQVPLLKVRRRVLHIPIIHTTTGCSHDSMQ